MPTNNQIENQGQIKEHCATSNNLPKVTQGQIVAATLRQIACQLNKLADSLDAEALKGRLSPPKKKRVSLVERMKRGEI